MGKSNEERLSEIDLKIEQLKNRKKELLEANQKQERANRNRRLIILGSRVEAFYKSLNIDLKEHKNDIPDDIQNSVYRQIAIGHAIEETLGKSIDPTILPKLISYIQGQEERGGFISKALFNNSSSPASKLLNNQGKH